MKYGELNLGQIEALVNKVGGMDGVHGILSGALIIISATAQKLVNIWKTIMVGGLSKKDELLKRLVDSGRNVSDWAKDIMGKSAFKMSVKPHEVSFVRVKVKDLGFTQNPTTTELFSRIKEVGELCQPEDGPWLALQDQPCGDIFWVAMEPIIDSGGYPKVFYVERYDDGERWLHTYYAYPVSHWSLDDRVVFRSRK